MKKSEVVPLILQSSSSGLKQLVPKREKGLAYAPTNIALCKYWGKRDLELNLPMTSSLSIALPDKGALTNISLHNQTNDLIILNGNELSSDTSFVTRTSEFLNLFRPEKNIFFKVETNLNIPVAAGLASSACGFASLVIALNDLFEWQLSQRNLSILARLGSGSAARSIWSGFVEWHAGVQPDGMDSYAEQLSFEWPELRVGLLTISDQEKPMSSRAAMLQTVNSSLLYANWPKKVARDMVILRQALQTKNFPLLAGTSESNALTMHATMLSSWPPICYFLPETIATMHQVWQLRREGLEVYFTEDAGPNLKLLFLDESSDTLKQHFPEMEVVKLFD